MAAANFTYSNETWSDLYDPRTTAVLVGVQLLLAVSVTLANAFGIVVMLHGGMWQRPSEVVLISLCLADLGLGIFVLPFSIAPTVMSQWPYGDWMCMAVAGFNTLFVFMSISCLMVFSIDRLVAIAWPYWYLAHVTTTRIRNVCIALWLVELGCASGPVIGWTEAHYYKFAGTCLALTDGEANVIQKGVCGVIFVLCIAVVVVTNIIIATVLQKHRRKITSHDLTFRVNTMQHYRDIFRSFGRLQYMTLTTLVTLTPGIVAAFLPDGQPPLLYTIGTWLVYSNSLWNIIIYSYRTTAFRVRAKRLWRATCKRCVSNEVGPTQVFQIY